MTPGHRPNRALLLTPAGAAAIAVVRLTGPGVRAFLAQHFSRKARPGRCVHGELGDGGRVIDDPVVVLSADGRVADVSLHGGVWVVRSMLELVERSGFEVVERVAGPVSDEAVDGDGVLQREAVAWLPLARTEPAIRILLEQPRLWNELIGSGGAGPAAIRRILEDEALYWLLHPPRVAIVGAPNVGKSTLANQLFAQERSITADLPGTTRDWVGEMANIDGLAVMLVDTPGVRQTEDAIERDAIERSGDQVWSAEMVVVVLDASQALEPEQAALLVAWPEGLRVINKSDRPAAWDVAAVGGVRTIATTGAGVDEVRAAIRARFGCDRLDEARPRWWTARQRAILERAAEAPERISAILGRGG